MSPKDAATRLLDLADEFDHEARHYQESIDKLGGPGEENAYLVGARDAFRTAARRARNLGSAMRLRVRL